MGLPFFTIPIIALFGSTRQGTIASFFSLYYVVLYCLNYYCSIGKVAIAFGHALCKVLGQTPQSTPKQAINYADAEFLGSG